MASHKENMRFVDDIFPQYLLDNAIEWINKNLLPEDVFSDKKLEKWAEENGYIEE